MGHGWILNSTPKTVYSYVLTGAKAAGKYYLACPWSTPAKKYSIPFSIPTRSILEDGALSIELIAERLRGDVATFDILGADGKVIVEMDVESLLVTSAAAGQRLKSYRVDATSTYLVR